MRPGPGQPLPTQPPPAVSEEPPVERPDGADVQFLPGYWAWDAETSRFLWVSGVYRNVPIGRQWVPGEWTSTPEGWRWVAGFWTAAEQQEVQYTPEPPAPLQTEPNVAPPSDDAAWMPGVWVYRERRFVWQPGYWTAFRPGRLWVPARYVWSPRSYIFCGGFWDYPLDERGLLFAPVVFNRPLWTTPGWSWRPTLAVNFGLVYDSCFIKPGDNHLFFGDYYGSRDAGLGYRPWYTGLGRYDPTFVQYWNRGNDRQWFAGLERRYRDRGEGRLATPPRTLVQQQTIINQTVNNTTIVNNKTVNNTTINNLRVVALPRDLQTENRNLRMVQNSPAELATQRAVIQRTRTIAATRALDGSKGSAALASGNTAPIPGFRLPPALKATAARNPGPSDPLTPKAAAPALQPTVAPHVNTAPLTPPNSRVISPTPKVPAAAPALHPAPARPINPAPMAPLPPRVITTPPKTAVTAPELHPTSASHIDLTPNTPLPPRVVPPPPKAAVAALAMRPTSAPHVDPVKTPLPARVVPPPPKASLTAPALRPTLAPHVDRAKTPPPARVVPPPPKASLTAR